MLIMRPPIAGVLMAALAACTSIPGQLPGPIDTGPASGDVAAEVVNLTNRERQRNGLAPLRSSSRLMDAADIHARQMADAQRSEHTLSGARYPTLQSRLESVGYVYAAAAENIAWNQRSAEEVVSTWMNSAGHRRNILDPNLTEMGAAMARSARGEPYWIQVFGRPR